jgi:signal transduction histidine kinase
VKASFSPFLAIRLPWATSGPGGVLLMPWEPSQIGVAEPYVEALLQNLAQQQVILAQVRSQISDEIIGRIRHMFKNRIGGIRMDVRELRAVAQRSPWQTDCAIDPEVALAMVKRKGFPPDHFQVGTCLARVEKALDSLTQIVDRISQYYRSGAVKPTMVNVTEEVAEKVGTWKRDRQDIAVEEKYDSLPAMVLIDRERFREVLDNLLTNCKEHLPVGDGHKLEVTVQVRREMVVVELSNSGPKDMPANPKEPYVTTSKTGGTGLGLTIVDRNVREAGGRFDFFARESAPGVTNRIELPNAHWELRGTANA